MGANINAERQFGFVECRNPTLTVMINLDAIVYQDALAQHRPQSYKPENASTLNFKQRGIAGLAQLCRKL